MIRLNLPDYAIKLSGTQQKPLIFDDLRRRYVALTPEEWVRQHFVHLLMEHLHYPAALLANEVSLPVSGKTLRADSVLYNAEAHPRAIIEYKAPTIQLSQKVFNQISAYNLLLHVDYLMVSNGMEHYCCRMDYERHSYVFMQAIPDYNDL